MIGACAGQGAGNVQPTITVQTTIKHELTTPPPTPMAPPAGVDVLVATTADEFDDISDALATATEQWAAAAPQTYAYRMRIDCECDDRGTTWVRVFDPDWPDEVPWDVKVIHARIRDALANSPDRIEVAFDDLGLPIWFSVHGGDSEAILVEAFHEIEFGATPFDGLWRFTEGAVDGEEFGNPTTGLIIATFRDGHLGYPIDCNEAGGPIDIHGAFFGIGPIYSTAAGCLVSSDEGRMFSQAVENATTIGMAGPQLVLSGDDTVLRLERLEQPERRDELPLTAAGETLVIEDDIGQLAAVFTISSGTGNTRHGDHPGPSVEYTLTAVDADSDLAPTWSSWEGEFEVPPPPSGPQEIVIPEDIGVADYQLCSPYWSGDFFCYLLRVRPASAPWYITAGADGVVLHDADGTSQTVSEDAARIAFWFEELLLVESAAGTIVTIRDSSPALEWAGEGFHLLDAGRIGDSIMALVAQGGETRLIDANRLDPTDLGPAVPEGRLAGSFVVLRPSPDRIEARSSTNGSVVWELDVEPHEMISSVADAKLRLDSGVLNTESSPVPFWQYLTTRVVDITTGEVIDELSFELAIPLEGDQVSENCRRAELRDGLMLCPQPDGRLATIAVEGGEMLAVDGVEDVIATYVR